MQENNLFILGSVSLAILLVGSYVILRNWKNLILLVYILYTNKINGNWNI
jgi:hypothetical protein